MRRFVMLVAGALLVTATAHAQGNPFAEAMATEAKSNLNNMASAAEAMPAEKYAATFPAPETNSFADLIYHAAAANYQLCALMTGDATPELKVKAKGGEKSALIEQMKASFAYCEAAYPKVDAARLGAKVRFANRDVTVAWVAVHAALDWGDHYAQVARLLRMNGIVPPASIRR